MARPTPRPSAAFGGPSAFQGPFVRQQRQAQARTDRATNRLPARPIAAPPVITGGGRRPSGAPLSQHEVQRFVSIRSPKGRQLQAGHNLIVKSIRTQLGNAHGRQRLELLDQILHEIQVDPRQANVRRAIRYYSLGQQAMVTPQARRRMGRDTVRPGPQPTRAKIGVGPLNLGTVNLTATGRAVSNALASAAPGLAHNQSPTGEFVRNAFGDLVALGKAPFVGAYGAGSAIIGDLAEGPGHTERETELVKGIVGGAVEEAKHPGESFQQHPVLTLLDLLGAGSVIGRTAGAGVRAAGSTVEAEGVRGALARAGNTVRPPLATVDDAGQPVLVQRTFSKDLGRKASQVAADKRREPLRDSKGNVVYVTDRGRRVPVLKADDGFSLRHPIAGHRVALLNSRADMLASRGNSGERMARAQAHKDSKVRGRVGATLRNARQRATGAEQVEGLHGRAARDLVAMAMEGTITSAEHFAADLRNYRSMVAKAIRDHETGERPYRHEGDLEAAKANLARVERVLADKRVMAQGKRIVAEAERHGARGNATDAANVEAGLLHEQAARRAALIVPAVAHMGGRHFTVEEHAALESAARKVENAAAKRYEDAKTPAERKAALEDLNTARERRIAVSGRDPERVRAHESAQAKLTAARARAKHAGAVHARAEQRVQKLAAVHKVERGREATQGPVAAYYVGEHRFTSRTDALAFARLKGVKPRDIRRVAVTSGEAKRVGELSQARRALKTATERRRQAEREARKAAHAVRANPLPEIRAGVRYGEESAARGFNKLPGERLPNEDIEAFLKSRGRNPETVAYLPHKSNSLSGRGLHFPARPGTRPVLDAGETRTGEAYRRGITESSARAIHDQGVRQAIALKKAEELDDLVSTQGLRHPAWAKAERGEALTPGEQKIVDKGGYFTAREAQELARRLGHMDLDVHRLGPRVILTIKGQRFVPLRAYAAKLDAETKRIIREDRQGPAGMDSLSERLLNDRIVKPDEMVDKRERNIVLVPAETVERLSEHMKPPGDLQRFLMWLNRPFRLAVLPQPRWLTGNAVEPYIVRLTLNGAGINVFGLGVDMVAATKALRQLKRGTEAERRAAQQIEAHQLGGMLIGRPGAAVRRTIGESLPEGVNRQYGKLVSRLPIVGHMAELTRTLGHAAVVPLEVIFRANYHMESAAERVALGKGIREDIQAITGSWLETIKLGQQAVAEAARGHVDTPTQHRLIQMQHRMLGQYEGYPPKVRALISGAAPFIPWALSAARFAYWTMPAHHSAVTALLIKTQQVMAKDWEETHATAPPGGLKLAMPTDKGGYVDLIRYTPWGLTGPIAEGDLQALTDQVFPQLTGAVSAIGGRDPFGRDLKTKPTPSNPSGRATPLQKVGIALNQILEATVPYLATGRRLREHGETPYSDSTIIHPKTKPNTSHGMSALRRTLDPFRPTYLTGSAPVGAPGTHPATRRPAPAQQGGSGDVWDLLDNEDEQAPAPSTSSTSSSGDVWDLLDK